MQTSAGKQKKLMNYGKNRFRSVTLQFCHLSFCVWETASTANSAYRQTLSLHAALPLLVGMARATETYVAKASYLVFGIATTWFLSLHASQTLRIFPRPDLRGRDLGIFNLTNTVPSLVMPWLTISLVPGFVFDALFLLLAGLPLLAVLLLPTLPPPRCPVHTTLLEFIRPRS